MITEEQFLEAQQLINDYIEQLKQANVIKSLPTDNPKFRRWLKKTYYEDAGGFYKYGSNERRGDRIGQKNYYTRNGY